MGTDMTGPSGSSGSSESALRILALDDDPVNRSLIRAIVSRASDESIRGATLHEATNLAEARSILAREAIDILLLDVHLPDGLGLDLAAEFLGEFGDIDLEAQDAWNRVPAVVEDGQVQVVEAQPSPHPGHPGADRRWRREEDPTAGG